MDIFKIYHSYSPCDYIEEQPWPHTATTCSKVQILYDLDVPLTEHLFLSAICLTMKQHQYQLNIRHVNCLSYLLEVSVTL